MVTIIDPHIKRDDSFPVSKQAKDLGLFVKNANNEDFEGWCWPGSSNWIDYLNPAGRNYWAEQFLVDKYEASKCP
jgi:alpha 1,3-glucosidase